MILSLSLYGGGVALLLAWFLFLEWRLRKS